MKRDDDFESRRQHLKDMSDADLEKRFWELCDKIVDPLINLAKTHTSPAVERSVLLRMGFSSIEANSIVERVTAMGLLNKGAGNVIYRLSKHCGKGIKETGLEFAEGRFKDSEVSGLFNGGVR